MSRIRQRGMTIVELMVAMVAGLIIIAGLSQIFLSGKSAYNLQEKVGDLQENGRFALFFLLRDLRMAGYPKVDTTGRVQAFPRNGTYVSCNNGTCTIGDSASDAIAISYLAPAGQTTYDCIGNEIAAGGIVRDYFFIQRDADGVSRLMCRSDSTGLSPAQTQPLVDGIENMQIQYGIDTGGDGQADYYRTADQVTNIQWIDGRSVVAVRVALLASSVDPIVGDAEPSSGGTMRSYTVLDQAGIVLTGADGAQTQRIRGAVFSSTIEIRNRTRG